MKLRNILKGGNFSVFLVVLFVIIAIIAFAYFQKTGLLADYKVNMFSSIGGEVLKTEQLDTEDLSIGVINNESEDLDLGLADKESVIEVIPATKDNSVIAENLGDIYTAQAEQGDSITRLARKLVKRYIDENGLIVSQEQKIYIEDYIQNSIGDYDLEIGDEISVSTSLISEAILDSQDLNEYQIDYYTNFVELIWDSTF